MSSNRSLIVGLGLIAVVALRGPLATRIAGATLPANFSDALVASVATPTGLAFTPDGRVLVTSQAGQLRVIKDGALLPTPALDLSSRICTNSERGLLGVAVDPNFGVNGYIYLFYTFRKNGVCTNNTAQSPVNRVSRFTLGTNDLVNSATELILIDNVPSPNGNHNGGDLQIGNDGYLYISIGDGGCDYASNSGCAGSNDAARDQHVLLGKILRITRTGGIPGDNPFLGSDSSRCNATGSTTAGRKCQETFAWGLRNPFRIAFDRNTGQDRFFVNDVGQNAWEEINEGIGGADYGWNVREGLCVNGSTTNCGAPPAGMTNPIHAYGRSVGASITGGAFVPEGLWPADFDGTYLFSDYVAGTIFRLTRQTNGSWVRSSFVTGLGGSSAVAMAFGPRGSTEALYYTTYAAGGQVRAITFTGATNRPPVASASASPSSGPSPLTVTLDASGSTDPDGDALSYSWNFGDGSAAATGARVTHTYASGTFTATVTVRDGRGGTDTATARVTSGNTAPTVSIASPASGALFRVGQTLTLQGSASDAQDGALAASRLTWTVTLHHASHTHPYLQPTTGNNINVTAPAPEDLAATTNSFITVRLTATDSGGLSTTVTREVRPRLVNVTFNTSPSGLNVTVNGTTVAGPTTLVSWDGYALNVNAPAQTSGSGQAYQFASWSDGGAAQHTIVTPATAASYTATFAPAAGGGGTGLRGEYYDVATLTGTPIVRTDPTVNFNWGSGSPDSRIAADTFSVRWTGFVQPAFSQTYTFYTQSDDGVRLWIDGTQVIGNWTNHASIENSGTIALTAGRRHAIRLEFYENTGGAVIQLSWSSPSQPKQIVPSSRLFPATSAAAPIRINFQPASSAAFSGYLVDSGAVYGARGNGQTYGWNANNAASARDRDAANSPDQRYDTLLHLQNSGTFTWELAVPSGSYTVRIVAGDAGYFDSTFRIAAEGVLVVNGTPTSAARWVEGTANVTVTDGRLTIANASGAANNKICFIEVTPR